MGGQGRNDLCRCGSGKKSKRCCGTWRGPTAEAVEEAFINTAVREARRDLALVRLTGLVEECVEAMVALPGRFPELAVHLPVLVDLELEALLRACADKSDEAIDRALPRVARRFDTPVERGRLARAVVRLRDEAELGRVVAAVCLLDLRGKVGSALVEAAVLQAAQVRAGAARTSSGLLIA